MRTLNILFWLESLTDKNKKAGSYEPAFYIE